MRRHRIYSIESMKEEEEDKSLLSSLGVTSADLEDIERDILEQARSNVGNSFEIGETVEDEPLDRTRINEPSASIRHTELYNKLRAIEIEIDAVASTVEQVNIARNEDHAADGNDRKGQEGIGEGKNIFQPSSNVSTLRQAVAADRLRSLRKTKGQLEEELVNFKDDSSKGSKHEKVSRNRVKEEPRRKRPLKDPKLSKNQKRRKAVSFDDDEEFDAVLNAASAGFVETVN